MQLHATLLLAIASVGVMAVPDCFAGQALGDFLFSSAIQACNGAPQARSFARNEPNAVVSEANGVQVLLTKGAQECRFTDIPSFCRKLVNACRFATTNNRFPAKIQDAADKGTFFSNCDNASIQILRNK